MAKYRCLCGWAGAEEDLDFSDATPLDVIDGKRPSMVMIPLCPHCGREIDQPEPAEPDGECFRGREAESYVAEQQSWIQRNLK